MTSTIDHRTGTDTEAVERAIRALVEQFGREPVGTRDGAPATGTPAQIPAGDDVPESRWLGAVLGQLAQVVAQAAPGILQGLIQQNRDVFGEGTRDAEAIERDFASVFGAIMPHLINAVPTIVSLFGGQRDMPADDEEAQTRFLLPLLGTVLPMVIQAVPSIVSALSGGNRDLVPSLTDPNVAPRWFGPVLSSVLPALVQNLPGIISIFTKR